MIKLVIYLIVIPVVIYVMDSININRIFKKNKEFQAKLFYILLVFCMSYLLCNFLYDFLYVFK